jgi:uncharacterized membrane protein YkvA (DUF1232 family)
MIQEEKKKSDEERNQKNYYMKKYERCWDFLEKFTHYLVQVIQAADKQIKKHSTITEGMINASRPL